MGTIVGLKKKVICIFFPLILKFQILQRLKLRLYDVCLDDMSASLFMEMPNATWLLAKAGLH